MIISVTQVRGSFDGCSFNKAIAFMDGTVLTCQSFGYSYAHMPSAVIFAKTDYYEGSKFYAIKALIDNEIYDMQPVLAD